jgi:hypothetical protein
LRVLVISKMKKKFTLPNILFGIFTVIIIGLGVRKYLQNQEAIAQWDIDHAEEIEVIRDLIERMK